MIRQALSYLSFAIALALFVTFFWRARTLGRDASRAGREVDPARKRGLNWILVAAILALAAAALL